MENKNKIRLLNRDRALRYDDDKDILVDFTNDPIELMLDWGGKFESAFITVEEDQLKVSLPRGSVVFDLNTKKVIEFNGRPYTYPQECSNCKGEDTHAWNSSEYVCLTCRYSSTYKEVMSQEDFDKWKEMTENG